MVRPWAARLHDAGRLGPALRRTERVERETFEKFRDGRGFTAARTLRERYGFAGEVRAVGHTIPDQFPLLLRCGVSTVEIPDDADPADWTAALKTHTVAYQSPLADHASALPLGRFALEA